MDDRNRRTNRITFVEGFIVDGKAFGKFAQRLRDIGGGLGRTDQASKTYPRLANVIGHIDVDKLFTAIDAVMSVQRDDGDRLDRLHARFKYTIDDKGLDWIQAEIGRRLGFALEPAQPYNFTLPRMAIRSAGSEARTAAPIARCSSRTAASSTRRTAR